MYIRGSNNAKEYRRDDQSFYKGIVVKNDDPNKLNRVKIFIPELSNQPLDNWLAEYKRINMRFPGNNNTDDVWRDTEIFEEISSYLPWAEQCFPLFGENGPARYQSAEAIANMNESNFSEGMENSEEKAEIPPDLNSGGFSPGFLFEAFETSTPDAFSNPHNSITGKTNPYSYLYKPESYTSKSKGVFSIPSVGSKVWVFHYRGDANFPVYFGARHDYRELSLINFMDNDDNVSLDYPHHFENKPKKN
jgi:hypothetical protein